MHELRDYLANVRRDAFIRHFCRKLLGYALGRSVQLSDEPLLDSMQRQLEQHDYRFSVAVEAIVRSPQFRSIRGQQWSRASNSDD
jgi:FKBP-type peptidyl-prolyl cis-trans isomerase (trigger factor)